MQQSWNHHNLQSSYLYFVCQNEFAKNRVCIIDYNRLSTKDSKARNIQEKQTLPKSIYKVSEAMETEYQCRYLNLLTDKFSEIDNTLWT